MILPEIALVKLMLEKMSHVYSLQLFPNPHSGTVSSTWKHNFNV